MSRNWRIKLSKFHEKGDTSITVHKENIYQTNLPPLLHDNMGGSGPSLVTVVYYHAIYLFVYYFSNVDIVSVHDSAVKTDFFYGA